jgi:uncharacterized membrane protein
MNAHVTTTFEVGFGVPGGTPVAVVLGVLLLLVALFGLRVRAGSLGRRVLLGALRVASASLAFALASQPTFWAERARVTPGALAVVVDVSRSMAVETEGTRSERAARLIKRWAESEAGSQARWLLLGETLSASDASKLRGALPAKAPASALLPELMQLAKSRDIGAIVVVSDGADTSGLALPLRLETRVHTVLVPDARPLRDDAIARIDADAVAFLHGEAKVHASIESVGLGERQLSLVLKRGDRVVTQAAVNVKEAGATEVELSFSPADLGREAYSLELAADPRDDVPENNVRPFLVRVTRDRLRVLHVSGKPSWDQRFLRGFLKRDPSIDLVSFFILRSVHDLTMSSPSELALIPFPTDELFRQHLTSFDAVLLQDFDYAPYQMSGYLPLLREYVRDGGGLAMIGGALSFDGGGYAETALAEVLPVRMRASDGRGAAVVQGDYLPEPALPYLHHPLLELYPESVQISAAFKALAPLTGMNELLGAREGAVVLLEHPDQKNARGERLPVLTVGGFGRGRTLAFATDTSWHWSMPTAGKGGDSSVYDRFWDRTVRFLTRDPLLDPARVSTDRESYAPAASIALNVLARDESYRVLGNADLALRVVGPQGKLESEVLLHSDAAGQAQGRVRAPEQPGIYNVELMVAKKALARAPFLVELSGIELAKPGTRGELLAQLARRSGGRSFADPESAPELSALDASRTTSLGSERHAPFANPLWASLALGLVMLEWWLRRRWGER